MSTVCDNDNCPNCGDPGADVVMETRPVPEMTTFCRKCGYQEVETLIGLFKTTKKIVNPGKPKDVLAAKPGLEAGSSL